MIGLGEGVVVNMSQSKVKAEDQGVTLGPLQADIEHQTNITDLGAGKVL